MNVFKILVITLSLLMISRCFSSDDDMNIDEMNTNEYVQTIEKKGKRRVSDMNDVFESQTKKRNVIVDPTYEEDEDELKSILNSFSVGLNFNDELPISGRSSLPFEAENKD